MAHVASIDTCGLHAQPTGDDTVAIPPPIVAWLYSVADAAPPDAVRWVLGQLTACTVVAPRFVCEVCITLNRMLPASTVVHKLPAYVALERSPGLAGGLLPIVRLSARGDRRAASYLLYCLGLQALGGMLSFEPVEPADMNAYSLLLSTLVVFADECTFPLTGDWYLHVLMRMHVPSWATQLSPGGAYADLAELLGEGANNIARPYIDGQTSAMLASRDAAADDVVLFATAVTLLLEVASEKTATLLYNRDLLVKAPHARPCPFIVCDFPIPGLVTDAYGYVQDGVLHIGNGAGVAATISAWIAACRAANVLVVVTEFLDGVAGPTNPLTKYATKTP